MGKIFCIIKRELCSYFATPVAYVFMIIILLLFGFTTFSYGTDNLFALDTANLNAFFRWHPRIYLLMIPAIAMHLWSEERRMGTIELLLTLPVPPQYLVIGKFLASWAFIGICLLCTLPTVWAVGYLGTPDYGPILSGYCGSFLTAGIFLAITGMTSALARNQVVSFILSFIICLTLVIFGDEWFTDLFKSWLGPAMFDVFSTLSVWTHYMPMQRGVIDFRDIFYFGSMVSLPLYLTLIIINSHRSGR